MNIIKRYEKRMEEIISSLNYVDDIPTNRHMALNNVLLLLFEYNQCKYFYVSKHPNTEVQDNIFMIEEYYRKYSDIEKTIVFKLDNIPSNKFLAARKNIKNFILPR